MKILDRLGRIIGLSGDRDAPPPRYRAVLPGVVVTDDAAWAWFEITPTNSDLLGESGRDAEQDRAGVALRSLRGMECHLRTVWGRVSGEEYLSGLALDGASEDQIEWARLRADNIDDLAIPARRVLLGVKLEDRGRPAGGAGEALGLSTGRVPQAQLDRFSARAVQIGQTLRSTIWRVRLASTELLAWSIVRETWRETPVPAESTITGASLATLSTGRVQPMFDHLQILRPDGQPAAYAAVLALTDFPELITSPGQEWIACLNSLDTEPGVTDDLAEPVPVLAEASIRFTVPTAAAAVKVVKDVHDSAKEQRKSAAKHSAEEPDEEILLAEMETSALRTHLQRGHTMLVESHPRIIVSATSREALDAKITAVRAIYDDMGITATVMVDEQREGWLESQLGDKVRVNDLGHWQDSDAFTCSWFWGGSKVGSTNPRIPAIGYSTGSTPNLVRFLVTESVEHSDAPVTVLLGRTRRGKTIAMMLAMLDAVLAPGVRETPWGCLIDLKGDADGLVLAGEHFHVPSDLLRVNEQYAGGLDPFQTFAGEHAISHTVSQLQLLIPPDLARAGESILQLTATEVAQEPDPWAYKVVERIVQSADSAWTLPGAGQSDTLYRDLGRTLRAATASGFGRLIAGRPEEGTQLPVRPGLTVIQLPGLTLPDADQDADSWKGPQRASVAALRGVLGWCTTIAGTPQFLHRPKVVGVPEVHLLTATADGRTFLTHSARMGAARGLSLLLDSQDVSGIASMTGLSEGIADVFGFAQQTDAEQRALARMVDLPDTDDSRAVIADLDRPTGDELTRGDEDVYEPRRGHALYRDRLGQVATVQWVIPHPQIAQLLDTSAQGAARRVSDRDSENRQTEDVIA